MCSSTRVLCLVACMLLSTSQVQGNIWHVSIDEGPAPSSEDGPPFSVHASRNPALLPAQICGIVGAYLASVLILGVLLLTVGRRLRSNAQSSQSTLAMEMVKPSLRTFDGSPVSPASTQRSWYSPRRLRKKPSAPNSVRSLSNPASPGVDSVASFDTKVLEADKAARQQEMERLYAAVMARDDKCNTVPESSTQSKMHQMEQNRARDRKPPRLLTSAPALQYLQNTSHPGSPISPMTPKSPIRAIYPPGSHMPPLPTSPTSPIRAEYPTTPLTPQFAPGSHADSLPAGSSNRVLRPTSQGSQPSSSGRPSKLRKSLRKIKISGPMARYPGEEDDDSARTPLSPRFYPDPGEPPSPPRSEGATTPGSQFTSRTRRDRDEEIDQIRDLPRPAPQRMSSYEYNNVPQAVTDINTGLHRQQASTDLVREQIDPVRLSSNGLPLRSPIPNASKTSTLGALPFRAMQSTQISDPLMSPGRVTRTTHLERRRDVLGVNGPPRTGLATPYSPYMPFTPLTPVTPHLTSRLERKQREREEGRRVLGQEDAVIPEDEMWGSAC